MEILFVFFFMLLGAYLLQWAVRAGVRDGIADAEAQRSGGGSGAP